MWQRRNKDNGGGDEDKDDNGDEDVDEDDEDNNSMQYDMTTEVSFLLQVSARPGHQKALHVKHEAQI